MQRGDLPITLVLPNTALTMEPNHFGYTLPSPCTRLSRPSRSVHFGEVSETRRNSLGPRDQKSIGLLEYND